MMKNAPIHVFAKSASVTLTTGIFFLVFTACTFGCGDFMEAGLSACAPTAREAVRDCLKLDTDVWLRVSVHRLETGEVLVMGKGWRWTSYYRVCVTSAFTWAVRHVLSFCHISAYSLLLEAAGMMNTRVNLSLYLSVCLGYVSRTAVRMRSTIQLITRARFFNGSHAAIRHPGIRVKHWSYGHSLTTLLNPCNCGSGCSVYHTLPRLL
jgi:hypothetical protein